MGNKPTTLSGSENRANIETLSRTVNKVTIKKEQKQRRKQKQQNRLKKLRSKGNNGTITISNTRPRTPILQPKIEENVSDIEDPEEGNLEGEEEEAPTLNEYFSQSIAATSPTATDSSQDRSFGVESFESTVSPQKKVLIDTTEMESLLENDDQEEIPNQQLPSSPLFSIEESVDGSTPTKIPSVSNEFDNNDEFSDASSQSDTLYQGSTGFGCDAISLDGSESLLSTGTSSEFDNMSKGNMSKGGASISDMSFSSIPSFIIRNKQQQRNESINNTVQRSTLSSSCISSVGLSSKNLLGASSRSIHSRMKRSRSDGSTSYKRPTASNAFETLPGHLIKTGLIRQAASTLRDERFLNRRIEKLGATYASKIHVSDFDFLQKRDRRNREKREKEREKNGGLEAELPTAQMFGEGDDYFSVMMDSFDLFLKCIMDMCGVSMNANGFAMSESCFGETLEEVDEEDDDHVEILKKKELSEQKLSLSEGGTAIMSLGKFLQKKGWHEDAMYFYRHALYIFLLEVNVDEPCLLDEAEDCDGLFYDEIAAKGLQEFSPVHELLGSILIKMGDVHGKNLEVNDAMRAYRASQVFWGAYLANHKASIQEERNDNEEDLEQLTDYAASIEGLALSHNRIGGVYTSKGDLSAALTSFHEALDLQTNALGDNHLEVAKTLHNIGVCHRHNDEWDEALEYYEKAHKIFEYNLGKNHLDTARTLHNIGGVYRRKKMYVEAMECFKQVLNVRRKILGDDHPSVSIALVSIAAVLRRSGRKEEANKFYAAAVR